MTNDKRTKADVVRKVNSILERMPPHNGHETVPRKFLVQVQAALTMPYAHRNGEADPPTETGRYWFKGSIDGRNIEWITTVIDGGKRGILAWDESDYIEDYVDVEKFVGQWWGPVPAPWEELQP